MKLSIPVFSVLLTLLGAVVSNSAIASVRNVDFNNLTYNLRRGGLGPNGAITLNNGTYKSGFEWVNLTDVEYADINGDDIEDAVVVLVASGGGSGASTHAFGISYTDGKLQEILYLLNFISIQPRRNGFTLVQANPQNTGPQDCPDGSRMRINAVDVKEYQWTGSGFELQSTQTFWGESACAYR